MVEINQHNKCLKFILPDGGVLDVLSDVFDEIEKWIQEEDNSNESGGYIVGYQHESTNNISLESISSPGSEDHSSRFRFILQDSVHKLFLHEKKTQRSYYMGVWHTHPEDNPSPSLIDWDDWAKSLVYEKSGCKYIFFIIAGRKTMRIWAGNIETKEIIELDECNKIDGVYCRRETMQE